VRQIAREFVLRHEARCVGPADDAAAGIAVLTTTTRHDTARERTMNHRRDAKTFSRVAASVAPRRT
jgi:hypothetical protein